ncbi:MAG: Unknown protein [uncultured Sulfurovum sp.]|uniref:Restriction endonuclease type IV Mrr domain-containing protein n=1 Tax=uncultured Sulfurovum sp. TaxID=269237 RepID=A0A6S6T4Y4_9BACT|nr:MAG: Unknown protein [uncultured Sulfurovum sp.]
MSILPKHKLEKQSDYIKITALAKFFSIEPRQLNQILTNMGWIEKKHYIWWDATDLGKKNGAIQHSSKNSRVRYVYWHKDIMYNEELHHVVKSTIRNYLENNQYEEFVKEYYTKQGYTVWHHAKEKTQHDKNKNITLVAKKNKRIILIHCRDNQLDISVDELQSFQQQRDDFKKDNPVFANYSLKLHYTMSGFFMTEEAYVYVEENKDDISYEVIKGESANTWLDSLLLEKSKA